MFPILLNVLCQLFETLRFKYLHKKRKFLIDEWREEIDPYHLLIYLKYILCWAYITFQQNSKYLKKSSRDFCRMFRFKKQQLFACSRLEWNDKGERNMCRKAITPDYSELWHGYLAPRKWLSNKILKYSLSRRAAVMPRFKKKCTYIFPSDLELVFKGLFNFRIHLTMFMSFWHTNIGLLTSQVARGRYISCTVLHCSFRVPLSCVLSNCYHVRLFFIRNDYLHASQWKYVMYWFPCVQVTSQIKCVRLVFVRSSLPCINKGVRIELTLKFFVLAKQRSNLSGPQFGD